MGFWYRSGSITRASFWAESGAKEGGSGDSERQRAFVCAVVVLVEVHVGAEEAD